jgi:hypothetical protein
MPKLDPSDVDQPTAADVAAASQNNAVDPSTTVAAPPTAIKSAPSLFGASGASNATTNSSSSGASTFGSSSTTGFGASSSGFGSSSTSGFGGSSGGGFGGSSGGFSSSGGFGQQQNGNMNQQSTAEAANAFGGIMAAQAANGGEQEHWMKAFWRPAMGWLYMLICFADFVVFPAITMFLPVIDRMFGLQMNYVAWQSLTLSNGGLIHLAFGAILGVSAYGRTQEKKVGAA